MKILLSPAKSLDEESVYPDLNFTSPQFLSQSEQLVADLQQWKVEDFMKIKKLSEALAVLNYERYQTWVSPNKNSTQRRPAIFAFNGEAYRALDIHTLSEEHYQTLNDSLVILSGLYGALRPFDWIFPYRLEMGTKGEFDGNKNLYDFWGTTILDYLNKNEKEVVFNLASEEYFKAARLKEVKAKVITPVFKELKNGQFKTVAIYAKNQRGKFSRFLIENPNLSLEEYQMYQQDGYLYDEKLSTNNEWIFVR